MKPKVVLVVLLALALAAVVSAGVFSHFTHRAKQPAYRAFQVHGQVRSIDQAEKTVRIAHDAIPNYMPAMTMSLQVKDPALLNNVVAGDEVQFELRVTDDDSWISHLEPIRSETALRQPAAGSTQSLDEIEGERLQAGELVPDFKLTDQDNRQIFI